MDKYLKFVAPVGVVVVLFLLLFGGQSANFGGVTNYDQLDAANPPAGGNAYTVSSTAVINAAGEYVGNIRNTASSTLGGGVLIGTNGSFITKLRCNSESFNAPSLATNATTTTDVALTGATSSAPQVYFASYQTSTVPFEAFAYPTSSANTVAVQITNTGPTLDDSGATLTVCYIQF